MKTLIAIPCQDQCDTVFVQSLIGLQPVGQVVPAFHVGSLVYTGRNMLAEKAITGGFDYVLWLDSDMVFDPMTLTKLMADMDDEKDIVCGLAFARRPPFSPVIWERAREGGEINDKEYVRQYGIDVEYPKDRMFEVEACGFGCVLMKTYVLLGVANKFHTAFTPLPQFGEDLSFCIRARECGFNIWCDPKVRVGHYGRTVYDEKAFLAWQAQEVKKDAGTDESNSDR